ncbi:hypothetical protein [Euzebya sp.]|uniref:hypothetical protein n=1 Tax=Euzebya sp. TaxID=1971409 RepID=UPI0035156DCE
MPRFAFALPLVADQRSAWHEAATALPQTGARAHRAFLLERGIFRERVWTQTGAGTPPLTLALWDCDDVDAATAVCDGRRPSTHERWLVDTVLRTFHGQPADGFAFPEPEVLSGTTTRATASAGAQTMFALPVPDEGIGAVRELLEQIEFGDLAGPHTKFLNDASIREEWIWLQARRHDLPAMLLVHWIGDDLAGAWDRVIADLEDPYATVLRRALFTMVVGIEPAVVAGWDVEQVLAMHVRRSDSVRPSSQPVAARLSSAIARRRWDVLQRGFAEQVAVDEPAGDHLTITLDAADAAAHVSRVIDLRPAEVSDVLLSDQQVLVALTDEAGGSFGVLFGLSGDRVSAVRVLRDWPGP